MNAAPPVSIGLPVYNGAQYLRQTLDDLLGQSYGDFELIVCDNASTDATPEILAEAATRDDRLVVVRNPSNIGALPNTNRAFECSQGERYVLAAHDDRHAPDFLARLVAGLDDDPEAVVAYGASTLIGADDRPFDYVPGREVYRDGNGHEYVYDRRLRRSLTGSPAERYRAVLRATDINAVVHGLFRRDALDRIGPHEIHGSDRLVVAHAALLGRFAYVDAPLFAYRIHEKSTYFLAREAWIERDTGASGRRSAFDVARTLYRYLHTVTNADLNVMQRVEAVAATLEYSVRPDLLRRLLWPGRNNYWGWTRWPWQMDSEAASFGGSHRDPVEEPGWEWLQGEPKKRVAEIESFDRPVHTG